MLTSKLITTIPLRHILYHEVTPRNSIAFQNLRIDEQYILTDLEDGKDDLDPILLQELLVGSDNLYADGAIFFLPTQGEEYTAEGIKQDIISDFLQYINDPALMDYRDEGNLFYLAFSTTKSGIWVFMSDASNGDVLINYMIDSMDSANPTNAWTMYGDKPIEVNNQTLYTTPTPEESCGSDFVNALAREKNAILPLMFIEDLITPEVAFEELDDE